MLSLPSPRISDFELYHLAASQPTVSIHWRPSLTLPDDTERLIIPSISVPLIQAVSPFCRDHIPPVHTIPATFIDTPTNHLHAPLLIVGNNGKYLTQVFNWIIARSSGIHPNILSTYHLDTAPLYQCHKLLHAADFLGMVIMRPFIMQKIQQVKQAPFKYSDAVPLLMLGQQGGTDEYQYVLKGVSEMVLRGEIEEDDARLSSIKRRWSRFAMDMDDALTTMRARERFAGEGHISEGS